MGINETKHSAYGIKALQWKSNDIRVTKCKCCIQTVWGDQIHIITRFSSMLVGKNSDISANENKHAKPVFKQGWKYKETINNIYFGKDRTSITKWTKIVWCDTLAYLLPWAYTYKYTALITIEIFINTHNNYSSQVTKTDVCIQFVHSSYDHLV